VDDDVALLYGMNPDLHTRHSNVPTASSDGVDGLNRLIPATPEGNPFAPEQAAMRRALFTIMLFCVVIVRTEGQTFGVFTNKYGVYGTNFISIAPWTSQGIFYQGDPVTISNSIGTTVEVYDFHGNSVTNAAPPVTLTNLKLGHYFVQVDGILKGPGRGFGDRSQFSVWPTGYTNSLHSDIGGMPTATFAESNRYVRLAPGFSRIQQFWGGADITGTTIACNVCGLIKTNGSAADTNTYDFAELDNFLNGGTCTAYGLWGKGCTAVPNPPVPVKVIDLIMLHCTNAGPFAPMVDTTNSLSSWVNDVAVTFSNLATRYSTNFVYEIMNEPGNNLVWPTNQNPYPLSNSGVYPSSLAVSAAVQAIQFVCPTCQTWGPAAQGLRNWTLEAFTDSFAVAGYTNVTALTFHGGNETVGPIDNTLIYTNPYIQIGGGHPCIWLPTDSNELLVAKIYGKPFFTDEQYPFAPDVLGKTNGWWRSGGNGPTDLPQWSWDWRIMTFRWWKDLIEYKATGVVGVQQFLGLTDAGINPQDDTSMYAGWDSNGEGTDPLGCGPRPTVDGQAMISWWLNNATLIANWLSGSPLQRYNAQLAYNGTPGLHFWEWQFTDGSTNTVIWADEGTTITTNLGVGLTDIFSNQWTGPIGIEPVIAWGWPNNSLGGSFSIVPVAAFSATPTYGPAPMTVTFTDGSAGAITSRSWQFGDGFVTNTPELTVVHRYTTPGSNTVQLIVSGPSGASTNAQSNMVIVTPFPPPLNGGGINGLPPVIGGGTNSVPPAAGGANNNWRFLIAY
jgi:hypothetical protein